MSDVCVMHHGRRGGHGDCPGFVWDGVDSLYCRCHCHPWLVLYCQDGDHDMCQPRTLGSEAERAMTACDCPCHFREMRATYLDLYARATSC